ncbi:sigma-54 interaction domain-containing protein [Virgibacillus sp. W0181]|uniref:sigma-54 interaction domain-containing protein n=1 Tax=Virgibacillus sp. W0181 TaxID=3391581 RepID=UPI003F46582D
MGNQKEFLEAELDSIIKYSNDNVVITDGSGTVLRTSPNCASIYGIDSSYLIGKSVFQLQEENIFSPSVTVEVLKDQKEVQVMQKTINGKVVMATGIPIFDKDRHMIRIISFSHDLTEIQQLKEDYEHLNTKMARYETEIEELRVKETKVEGIIVKSEAIKKVWDLVYRMAKSDASTVLLGESGVGKSMFARALHNHSDRWQEAFIEVNCGAIPDNLFESEVFGYEPGAFTGASPKGRVGLIELADQGTLFLDEIAEIPIAQQVKLLKVLEEKKVTRVGGSKSIDVDFRIVTATNQDLSALVQEGKFREDLFYRLNVVPIHIPPLRERKEDIYQLALYFLEIVNEKYNMEKTFYPATLDAIQQYKWPGNVRELENLVERLVVTSDTNMIYPSNLPFVNEYGRGQDLARFNDDQSLNTFEQKGLTLQESLEEVERAWLTRAYRQYKTTYEMADYLGVSQATVVRRLKKYNINSK